ncbi:MAG: CoA-binding protein [Peptococcaceae bacterium]|nr:CoA-binding protein [Peptococcaceae bacterium]
MKRQNKYVYDITNGIKTNMTFAVYASSERFIKHKHAWKVWRTLQEFGCKVYIVAENLSIFEGHKVYPDLKSLEGKIDVVIPCLRTEYLQNIVKDSAEAGAKYIWFQEDNWDPGLVRECEELGVNVNRGCVLKHKLYKKPFAFLNPCYWHGLKEKKVPAKYQRI